MSMPFNAIGGLLNQGMGSVTGLLGSAQGALNGALGGALGGITSAIGGGGGGGGSSGSAGGAQFAVPNPLQPVEQLAYHWKFWVAPDIGYTGIGGLEYGMQGPVTQEGSSVVIAESGLTGFNIKSVEVDSFISPDFQTRNQGATKFRITIIEQMGANLPDAMVAAAATLNIKNLLKCPYYLTLKFHGYDTDSGAYMGNVGGGPFQWRIMITSLKTNVTTTGSEHVIEAIHYDNLGSDNIYNLVPNPINVDVSETAGTIGDVMSQLTDELNANIRKRYDKKSEPLYTIVINDEPYPSDAGLPVSRPFEHKIVRDQKHKDSSRNQSRMQVSRGTDITKIFEYLISSSDTGVLTANPTSSSDPEDVSSGVRPSSFIHKVESTVAVTGWDPDTREYRRTITFTIRPYEIQRITLSGQQDEAAQQIQGERINKAVQQALLRKAYDYTFTGLNTEVLNVDLQLNFNFVVATNLYKGHIFTEMASSGIEYDPDHFPRQRQNEEWVEKQKGPDTQNKYKSKKAFGFTGGSYIAEDQVGDVIGHMPRSFVQDGYDPRYQVSPSVENNNLRGRSLYGAILDQVNGTIDGNLQSLDLEIRGDPYWLGSQDRSAKSSDTAPNFLNGEHMYMLKFFLPQGVDEEGKPILNVTEMYSGFYAVTRVLHSFSNGQFTQTLTSTRIPNMSITKFMGGS